MRRAAIFYGMLLAVFVFSGCRRSDRPASPGGHVKPYIIGIFQSVDSPTANEVRRGILQAFEDSGLRDGENIHARIRIAAGNLSEVQKIAREFVTESVDMIMPLTTQCLQAALLHARNVPIVFGSVATPFLVGAGRSPTDHLPNVTGVVSTGPVRQTVRLIHAILPRAKRVGTLWTPSEVNSGFYLELAREAASELGLEIVAVPVASAHEIPQSTQVLVNQKVDVLFPISDNTINTSFEVLGRVAEENRLPLFGGFLRSVEFGAAAAMGFDFYDMGYKTGKIAVRVKNGESPGRIPIEAMDNIKVFINLDAATKQGVSFPPDILRRAARILPVSSGNPATQGSELR